MSILSGPNLVGGDLTDLVIPVLMDHGPWEFDGRLFGVFRTNETFSGTVIGGACLVYSSTSPSGPSVWTREVTTRPAATNPSYYYVQPDFDGQNIVMLAQDIATGQYGICEFDCSARSYGSVGTLSSLVLSTLYPVLLKKMLDGSYLVFGTGAGDQAGFYRYSGGTWSSFVALDNVNRIAAVVHDGVSNTAHCVGLVDTSPKAVFYQKVFADNSKNITENVLNLAVETVGQYGIHNYGHCYEFFDGKMHVQCFSDYVLYSLESSDLDDTSDPATFTQKTVYEIPEPEIGGARTLYYGNYVKAGGNLYLVASGILYNSEGAVTEDKIYASQYSSGADYGSRAEVADFIASPPTIPTPGEIPAPGSEYSHFHSIHGISDGTAGTLCDFFVDVGGVFCTTYYTNFSLSGGFSQNITDSLELTDEFGFQTPEENANSSDSLSISDAIDLLIDGNRTLTQVDILSLSDSVLRGTFVISGPPDEEGFGGPGGSGGFPTGGLTNQPSYCIFEFYSMEPPENVEVLPVPKKYDQLGPVRFDKIGKLFAFRVRLIMNGSTTSVPYQILGDDSISSPHYNDLLFEGSFPVRPGIDNVYEIKLPKNINSDVFRLVLGPTTDSFHRYDVMLKIQVSGMPGQSKWMQIR